MVSVANNIMSITKWKERSLEVLTNIQQPIFYSLMYFIGVVKQTKLEWFIGFIINRGATQFDGHRQKIHPRVDSAPSWAAGGPRRTSTYCGGEKTSKLSYGLSFYIVISAKEK